MNKKAVVIALLVLFALLIVQSIVTLSDAGARESYFNKQKENALPENVEPVKGTDYILAIVLAVLGCINLFFPERFLRKRMHIPNDEPIPKLYLNISRICGVLALVMAVFLIPR